MQIGHSLGVNNTKVRGQATIPMAIKNILKKYNATLLLPGPSGNLVQTFQPGNYVESTGQTLAPVDSAVGLAVDAAAGALGPELVVNGDFSNGTTGWSITAVAPSTASVVGNAVVLYRDSAGAAPTIENTGGLTAEIDKWYSVSFNITTDVVISNFGVSTGGATQYVLSSIGSNGSKRYVFKANATGKVKFILGGAGPITQTIDNISVREITGIHATQATTQYKPSVRRGLVNLQQKSGDISTWGSTAAGVITAGQPDPLGGTSAQKLAGAGKNVFCTNVGSAAGTYTFAFELYSAVAGTVKLGAAGSSAHSDLVDISAGWNTYCVTKTVSSSDGCVIILSGTLSEITFYRAGMYAGTLTAQQIIDAGGIPVTTSAPASSTRGSNYWQFDGTDDRLQLGYNTDQEGFVVVAGRPDQYNKWQSMFGTGAQLLSNPGVRLVARGVENKFALETSNGTATTSTSQSDTFQTGTKYAVTGRWNALQQSIRIDGTTVQTSPSTVAASTNGAAIGAAQYGVSTVGDYFNGQIHAVIFGKGAITDNELLTLEKFVAKLQGRQL